MTRPKLSRARARSQRGAVLVTVAAMLPVLLGFAGLAVDVGNWFAHKRHLQTQADAGALAGASQFRVPCDNDRILAEVSKYSSVEGDDEGYNPQIGETPAAELHQEINSQTWYDQETPVDDTVRTGAPCEAKMIDVKLTETNLPWYLKIAQVPYINTQARVEIRQQDSSKGALPVGVPEVGPKRARAVFVNETTGAVVASTDLTRTGTAGGLSIWSNVDAPVPVTVNTTDIGVRIVLSGSATTTACGDPLVDCYGAGTTTAIQAGVPGLSHIRGYDDTTTVSAGSARARSVQLFSGGCEDGYFTATATYPCKVNIGATVDFGGAAIGTIRVLAKKTGANNNTAVALTPPATSGGTWTGQLGFDIDAGSGAHSIDLLWQTGCDADRTKPCNQTRNPIPGGSGAQRAFAATEALTVSGPIKLLRVAENAIPGANSFPACATCTHNLSVTVGLKPSLQNAQAVSDPVVSLKVAGGGSQNQGLDCDPDLSNIRDELENGCEPGYKVNTGQACPANPTALWGTAQPWNCVAINTGATVGQVTQGMNQRILGDRNPTSCTSPNNWADFPDFDPGDPRIVQVFLAPFGAFGGSGSGVVPVTGFATFYVTGWDGGACQGVGDDAAGQGSIVGHFFKYIDTLNDGGGGEEFCDFDSLGSCVAVFTR